MTKHLLPLLLFIPFVASALLTSNLRQGQINEREVRELETTLKRLGYFKETPDGYYSKVTERAVKNFQKANKIISTGIIGKVSRDKLNAINLEYNKSLNKKVTTVIPPITIATTSTSTTVKTEAIINTNTVSTYVPPTTMGGGGGAYASGGGGNTSENVSNNVNDGANVNMSREYAIGLPIGKYVATVTGTAYYVDNINGNDNNNGSITKPWKTLSKASTAKLNTNDALLLNCGSTWREPLSIGNNISVASNVLIAAYGDCDENKRPIIKASDIISGPWINDISNSNVYMASSTKTVNQVFWNGNRLIEARHPNYPGSSRNGYSVSKNVNSQLSFQVSDNDRSIISNKDMTDANAYIKSEPWYLEMRPVSSYDSATGYVNLANATNFTIEAGNSYGFTGKKWMLDSPGEWYYDKVSQNLYIWPPIGNTPGQAKVEASVRYENISLYNIRNSKIEHIGLEHSSANSLNIYKPNNVTVTDLSVSNDKANGIVVENSNNVTLNYSYIKGSELAGLVFQGNNDNVNINHNTIENIGTSGNILWSCCAISITSALSSSGLTIEYNKIKNTSYHGISFANLNNTIIKRNVIEDICIRFSDCGAIYTYNSGNIYAPSVKTIIEDNAIINAHDNLEPGESAGGIGIAAGIYLDNYTNNVIANRNMISSTTVGILLHETYDINVTNNKTWRTLRAGLYSTGEANTLKRNQVYDNTFFSAYSYLASDSSIKPLEIYSPSQIWSPNIPEYNNFNTNSNSVYNNKALSFNYIGKPERWRYVNGNVTSDYTSKAWNNWGPKDIESSPLAYSWSSAATSGLSFVINGNMNGTGTPWSAYYANGTGTLGFATYNGCDSSCAKFNADTGGDLILSNVFNLMASVLYQIKITVIGGIGGSDGSAIVRSVVPPYESYGYFRLFPHLNEGEKFDIEDVFQANSNNAARLDLYSNAGKEILFDNVSLHKVDAINYFNPYNYSVHLINASDKSKTFNCSDTGMLSCDAVDESGNKVSWPYALAPWSSQIVMARNSQLLR